MTSESSEGSNSDVYEYEDEKHNVGLDVPRFYTNVNVNYGQPNLTPQQKRYEQLMLVFKELARVASKSEKATEELKAYILKYKQKMNLQDKVSSDSGYNVDFAENARQRIIDIMSSEAKGRPRENSLKRKSYKLKKRCTTSRTPTSNPICDPPVPELNHNLITTVASRHGGIVTQENMISTPPFHMSHMDVLMGVHRPQMYNPRGTYNGDCDST